jgi:carbon storage regulator
VLARKPNQSIMIGDEIEIKIIEVKGDQVKVGINAPRHVSVHRKEVYEEIVKANIEATGSQLKFNQLKNLSTLLKKKNEENNQEHEKK